MHDRGEQHGLKTNLFEKHNNCPVQKMPPSTNLSFNFPNAEELVKVKGKILPHHQSFLPFMRPKCIYKIQKRFSLI